MIPLELTHGVRAYEKHVTLDFIGFMAAELCFVKTLSVNDSGRELTGVLAGCLAIRARFYSGM